MPHSTTQLEEALRDCYTLERELGRGGMATVYLARDRKHDRPVALKVIHSELASLIGRERFVREIRTAAHLQHPHILPLLDSGEAGGLPWYTMPYVDGESLRLRLLRESQLPLEQAIRIATEVADALDYAHRHGVLHRDVKPENILLSGPHAVVADFGVARALGMAGGERLTASGIMVGTPAYMSPEQADGDECIDGRSDLYGLGCVLYEMLAGEPPFTGRTPQAIIARRLTQRVPSLSAIRDIPEGIERTVLKSLALAPADRYPDVAHFATALTAAAAIGSNADTGRRTPPEAKGTSRRTFRGAWPLAAAALATIGVLRAELLGRPSADSFAPEVAALDPHHVAVLYFTRGSGADSLGHLADGLTEALIHALSGVPQLRVISGNGVLPYKQAAAPLADIARTLGVGTLVQGSVAESGNRLRVNVSLIDAASGVEIGSRTLEQPREEIFALQDDLTEEVSAYLRKRLGQEVQLRQSRAGTSSAAAWELFQRARVESNGADRLAAAGDTAGAGRQIARADAMLARAEAQDSGWSAPIAQRGWLAYRRSRLSGTFDKPYYDGWTRRGLGHAGRALTVRSDDADALELRGTLRYWRWLLNLEPNQSQAERMLEAAEGDLRAAVELDPIRASGWNTLSHLLLNKSQSAEARFAALRAYEADPYLTNANLTLWRLFTTSTDMGDPADARHWCEIGERRFRDDPRFAECRIWLNFLPGQQPDVSEAWDQFDRYLRLTPGHQREFRRRRGEMLMGIVLARAGLGDSARAVMLRARADPTLDPTRELAQFEAVGRTILGDRDEAISLLATWIATNPQQRLALAQDSTWWYAGLREDPRYAALMASGK